MSGMLANYDFVSKETLAYFSHRPPQAKRDADWALAYVKTHAKTPEEQRAAIKALEFKCNVLWAQLDALWGAYVDHALPPDAWVPGTIAAVRGKAA
jgi:coenzyme PQQ biosynthesis protein C